MKADIIDLNGHKVRTIELPKQFQEEIRLDLIKRSNLALRSHKRQPYGAFPLAGQQVSAKLSRRRIDYKTAYGKGISRSPRKTLWRRGTNFMWVGALAPNTVKGREAHPPKSQKNIYRKINKKERRKAIRSAISASVNKEFFKDHKFNLPIIINSDFENIKKTKELQKFLIKIGLESLIDKVKEKKIRAGKGKARGRKYIKRKGPLIVVSDNCSLLKCSNLPGFDIVKVNSLNTELLAPGFNPRLIIWSEKAIEKLEKENLFYDKK